MSEKKLYPVLSNVRHSGTLYKPYDPGLSTIALTAKEAQQLLKLKVIGDPLEDVDAEDATVDLVAPPDLQPDPASADTPDISPAQPPEGQTPEDGESGVGVTDPDAGDKSDLTADERKQTIINAFQNLKAEEDLTKAGEPKVAAIEKLVGFDVSADEVRAIWAEVQAQSAALKAAPKGE